MLRVLYTHFFVDKPLSRHDYHRPRICMVKAGSTDVVQQEKGGKKQNSSLIVAIGG